MIVDPTRGCFTGYAKYALSAAAGVLLLGACDSPEQNTDLRPEGPPDVLAVLVMTDPSAQLVESATYCRTGDEKRPTTVGLPDFTLTSICDEDMTKPADMVTSAYPDGWYVRIMFDELLDPEIEELTELLDPDTGEGTDTYSGTIANTQPVILECESVAGGFVEVPYDGYYSPAGNSVTWPLGPALVIKPDEPRAIATNKMCRVTLRDNITDKSGNVVPADQRGPYSFKIAPITPIVLDPGDGAEIDAFVLSPNGDNVYVQFNTAVDPDSFCDDGAGMDECEFSFSPVDTGTCDNVGGTGSGDYCVVGGPACATAGETCIPAAAEHFPLSLIGLTEAEFAFYSTAPVQTEKEYTFAFKQGGKVKDRCGVETTFGAPSVADQTMATYTTHAFDNKGLVPSNGDTVSVLRKPDLTFNNVIDIASLTASEYTLTPAPNTPSVASTTEANALFAGHYAPSTMYTLTINAGATVNDAFGKTWTNDEAKTITWTTQPIAITSISPANNGVSIKATPASTTRISISFNQSMDPTTLAATEFTLTSTTNTTPIVLGAVTVSGCGSTSTTCALRASTAAPLAPGSYKFTLNAGATISDVLGNEYTQAAARSVTFTVANAAPGVVCL